MNRLIRWIPWWAIALVIAVGVVCGAFRLGVAAGHSDNRTEISELRSEAKWLKFATETLNEYQCANGAFAEMPMYWTPTIVVLCAGTRGMVHPTFMELECWAKAHGYQLHEPQHLAPWCDVPGTPK